MQHKGKYIAVITCMLLCVLLPLTAFAHSGRTDSRGGHYDSQMGMYHYHHGFPAHGHPDGVCPFDPNYEENLEKTARMDYTDPLYEEETQEPSTKSDWSSVSKAFIKSFSGKKLFAGVLVLLSLGIFGIILYRLLRPIRHDRYHQMGTMQKLVTVSGYVAALVALVGIICFFSGYNTAAIICGVLTLVDSGIQIFWGDQNNIVTEVIAAVVGLLIGLFTDYSVLSCVAVCLCASTCLMSVLGLIGLALQMPGMKR